jgi:hypothetical protein
MYYKIITTENGQYLKRSQTQKDGYKPLISEPIPQVADGKKAIGKLSETETHVISGWEIVDKTAQEKIIDLEAKQTARLTREAAIGNKEAIATLKDIDDKIAELRKEI